ncbi:MAG TPA: DUF58 domain-containing protein [Bacilli bacterium]|nr:DUF58 domain-containing protein [Bacilli bacterium]
MSRGAFITPAFLGRLERMRLLMREVPSLRGGARRTRQVGTSVEFAEYKPYTPGDDLRHLDWRAYARLGKLFRKTFLDERDALLYLLVDVSHSMMFGDKLQQAQQMAAALGYLALAEDDRVEAWVFAEKLRTRTPRLTGKPAASRLFDALQAVQTPEEATEGTLNWLVRGGVPREPGVVVLLSDFLFQDGYEEAIRRLQLQRHQIVVVQVLAREELDPPFMGDVHLIDSETGGGKEVALSPHVVDRYRQAVADYTTELQDYCRRRGLYYALLPADESLEDAFFRRMVTAGVIGR